MKKNNNTIPITGPDKSRSYTVLIVDDAPKNIQVIGAILEEKGYQINVAMNGGQAVKTAREVEPDLILLDIMMPDMDGFETCAELKSLKITKDIPIIFLTARAESEDIIKGFNAGGVDYVTKPFNKEELLARIETHLELRESKKTIENISNDRKELLHVLCHDLAAPFLFLKALLKIEKEAPHMFDENRDKYFKNIKTTINNSLDLIEQIRTMRDSNTASITFIDCNLLSIADHARFLLQEKLNKKNITLNININENLNIYCDEASFTNSVLLNILSNAIKYSYKDSEIDISAVKTGDAVEISIRDYGIGIPEKIIKNILNDEKYKDNIRRPGTEGEQGNGVGLSLVKKFIALYKGNLSIESKTKDKYPEDHGACIIITLNNHLKKQA